MSTPLAWHLGQPAGHLGTADWSDDVDLETIECPVDPNHQRGGRRLTDLSVLLSSDRVEDVVWTWMSECLVQESVLRALRAEGITGYVAQPAKATFASAVPEEPRGEPPALWELTITGWAGMAPPDSGIRLTDSCRGCGLLTYSCFDNATQLFRPGQWDGSDFFMIWPLPRYVFVSQRLASLLRNRGFTGFILQPISDLTCSGPTLSPGRLTRWMPRERAINLGGPLGIA